MENVIHLIDYKIIKLLKLGDCHPQYLVEYLEEKGFETNYILESLQRLSRCKKIGANDVQEITLKC